MYNSLFKTTAFQTTLCTLNVFKLNAFKTNKKLAFLKRTTVVTENYSSGEGCKLPKIMQARVVYSGLLILAET